jgi:hypothetical protein
MIGLAAEVEPVLAGRGIDAHATDGITNFCAAGMMVTGIMGVVLVVGVVTTAAAASGFRRCHWLGDRHPRSAARAGTR